MEESTLPLGHNPEDPGVEGRDQKRMTHNMVEKRRKDRIKQWISHIAQLLPPASSQVPDNRPSTLDIMERAANYITELKTSLEKLLTEKGDAVLIEEMNKMRTELQNVRADRDRLFEALNNAGVSVLTDTSLWKSKGRTHDASENGTASTSSVTGDGETLQAKDDDSGMHPKAALPSSSSKRRNTISAQLEQQKLQQEQQQLQQEQQQQALAQAMAGTMLSQNGGLMFSGLPGQNVMMSPGFPHPMMVSPSGQVMMAGSQACSTSRGINTSMSRISSSPQKDCVMVGVDKNSSNNSGIGGLLQIAMQDAGITPSMQLDSSRQPSPAPAAELQVDSAHPDPEGSRSQAHQCQPHTVELESMGHDALQTLASVASNTVNSSSSMFTSLSSAGVLGLMQMGGGSTSLSANTVTVTSSAMNQNVPIMSVGQIGQLQQQQQQQQLQQQQLQQQQTSQASLMMGMNLLNPLSQNTGLGMVGATPGQNPVLLPGSGSINQGGGPMGMIPGPGGPAGMIPGNSGPTGLISAPTGPGGLAPGSILMNQQGQLLVINENGIPVVMPVDPSGNPILDKNIVGNGAVSMSGSAIMTGGGTGLSILEQQQQALINSGALTISKSDSNVPVSMSHPQSSILAGMNPQAAGQMNFLSNQLPLPNTLQSLALQQTNQPGGFLQPGTALNQQLMQSLGLPFPGVITGSAAGGLPNSANHQTQQGIVGSGPTGANPAGNGVLFQSGQAGGMMTLNTVPSNPHQLPSALVLPSGHVIPVVSNPQLMPGGQGAGLISTAPGSGGVLTSAAGPQIQLQQMAGGAGGAGQVIQVDSNNPNGAQIFIGPSGLQVTASAGQGALSQQQQLQQILQQQQQNLSLIVPTPSISSAQTSAGSSLVTLASTVVTVSAAQSATSKSQLHTTQVLTAGSHSHRNGHSARSQTPSAAGGRKTSQASRTSSTDIQFQQVPLNTSAAVIMPKTSGSLTGTSIQPSGVGGVSLTAGSGPGTVAASGGATGASGGGAPILLMMQHNGQLVNLLVDPVTMQVLNSGQGITQATSGPTTLTSDSTTSTSSVTKKSSKKSNAQRAVFPKPKPSSSKSSSKSGSSASKTTVTSSSSSSSSTTSVTTTTATSMPQQLIINTDGSWDNQPGNAGTDDAAGSQCSEGQDILAKAAQSIFTASPTDISPPIGGFYNPAHEDNPLLIDTSAGDGEEESGLSSPRKGKAPVKVCDTSPTKKADKVSSQQETQNQLLQQQEQQKLLEQQQEEAEHEKLLQQQREQHEQLIRHLEQQQQQISLMSPTQATAVPPSMPTLVPTSDMSFSLTSTTATASNSATAASTSDAAPPAPKKPKKSKSKKKDKDKKEVTEKESETSKPKKSSSKKKKKEGETAPVSAVEAAEKRREEINQKQQQLLLQQQEQRQQEQEKQRQEQELEKQRKQLQQQQQEDQQLLLLQHQQQQQEQQAPALMSEPQLVQPPSSVSATDMIADEDSQNVVSAAFGLLPDTITFTESEISDVLDQVENLGNIDTEGHLKKYEKPEKSEKKEKQSKKSRKHKEVSDSGAIDENPSKKQRKAADKSADSVTSMDVGLFSFNQQLNFRQLQQQHNQQQPQEEINSSSRMSIYDFQDDSPPGVGAAEKGQPSTPKPKSKKSKNKSPANSQASSVTIASSSIPIASSTNTPPTSLDSLPPLSSSVNKNSDMQAASGKSSKLSKCKKKDKKGESGTGVALSNAGDLNISGGGNAGSGLSETNTIQINTTMSSSKSNDSLSTGSADSTSVIIPMPGFETLDALNSPAPLISPSSRSETRGQGQIQGQGQDQVQSPLGQIPSVVTSVSDRNVCPPGIDSLADIAEVGDAGVEPLLMQASQPTPPVLHHPPTQNNSNNLLMVPQQQKQQQQQQQSGASSKQRQQTPPGHTQPPQMPSHSPQMTPTSTPQNVASQPHAKMRPPTSPAQAVGRPRSTSLPHQQQQQQPNQQTGYPSSSPQAGGAVRQSPSASCISPSSSHSRSSHDGQNFNQSGGHMAPTLSPSSSNRMNDMSSLLGSPELPCPNANLFGSPTTKLSHMQKSTSQGKPSCSEDSAASRSRSSIYSADNFVSSQNSNVDPRSQQSNNSGVQGGMGRMPALGDVGGDSFNFTSIGLNLTSASTPNTGQEMGIPSSAGAPFSFSLTSAATTQTSASSSSAHTQAGHHGFPFYPLHPSVTQPSGAGQPAQNASLNMLSLGPDLQMDNQPPQRQSAGPMSSGNQNSFGFGGLMDITSSCSGGRDSSTLPGDQPRIMQSMEKSPMGSFNQHHSGRSGAGGQKRLSDIQPSQQANRPSQQPTQPLDHNPPINRSPQQMSSHSSKTNSYYPASGFPSSASLNTPPLRHPPLPTADSSHLMNRGFDHSFTSSQSSNSLSHSGQSFDHRGMAYQRDLNHTRPLEHVSSSSASSSRKPSAQQQQQQQGGGSCSKQQKQGQSPAGGSAMSGVPQHQSPTRSLPPGQNSSHSSTPSQQRSAPPQAPPPAHQTSGNGHAPAPSPNQQRQAKRKQTSSQSKKSKPAYSTEIDANLSHSIFDSGTQSLQSFFSFQNMSPPPGRNLQSEGPPFLAGNLFGSTSRPLSNSSNKNTPDLGPPYALFPPARPQNGLGLNFQPSFGMNAMTGNHGSGHMTPHSVAVTPHMSNFSLSNIFTDVNGGSGDSGLNISPIKFPHHANPILPPPQAGMDPNTLQHPHQGSALYHNRPHHGQPHVLPNAMTNAMTLNSILGHNHHGFDARSMGQGINSSVGPPFHGPGHPSSFAMPPLNFSMHDH